MGRAGHEEDVGSAVFTVGPREVQAGGAEVRAPLRTHLEGKSRWRGGRGRSSWSWGRRAGGQEGTGVTGARGALEAAGLTEVGLSQVPWFWRLPKEK